jgi:hypothetical protein
MCQFQRLVASIKHPARIGSEMRAVCLAAVIAQVSVAQKAEVDAAARLHALHAIAALILDKRGCKVRSNVTRSYG